MNRNQAPKLPFPDQPGAAVWRLYEERAREEGAAKVLRGALVEFAFPVAEGMSQDEEYLAATRRGAVPFFLDHATGLELVDPLSVEILVHASPAGAVPVVSTGEREDFELMVQALTHRNEPEPVPEETALVRVSGLVNWDRVKRLRKSFLAQSPGGDWEARLKELAREPRMIRDDFLLLYREPNLGIDGGAFDLDWDDWAKRSVRLTVEREATRQFMLRVSGEAEPSPAFPLLADYMGIVEAFGSYRADVARRLLGRGSEHDWGEKGERAVENLVAFDSRLEPKERDVPGRARTLMALSPFSLEELAEKGAPGRIRKARRKVKVEDGGWRIRVGR